MQLVSVDLGLEAKSLNSIKLESLCNTAVLCCISKQEWIWREEMCLLLVSDNKTILKKNVDLSNLPIPNPVYVLASWEEVQVIC